MRGYFDGNATTPTWEEAIRAWENNARECWGNPSALYGMGAKAKAELQRVRERIAESRGVSAEAVVFTGGATEANNAVLRHWLSQEGKGVVSVAEHPSVAWVLKAFPEKVENWPVKNNGQVSLNWLRQRLKQGSLPTWIALQSVNNETGVIQPLQEVSKLLKGTPVKLLCDRSQQYGKLELEVGAARVWEVVSAHKFGGPKGVGWLVSGNPEERIEIQRGGAQENGYRAGTENLAGVVAMEAARQKVEQWRSTRLPDSHLRDELESFLKTHLPGVQVVGEEAPRVWNTSLLIMPRHENHRWVTRMNRKGYALATGAACSTGKLKGSDGLKAMGYSRDERGRVVRISAGWWTAPEEWQGLGEALLETWQELEKESSESNVIVIP